MRRIEAAVLDALSGNAPSGLLTSCCRCGELGAVVVLSETNLECYVGQDLGAEIGWDLLGSFGFRWQAGSVLSERQFLSVGSGAVPLARPIGAAEYAGALVIIGGSSIKELAVTREHETCRVSLQQGFATATFAVAERDMGQWSGSAIITAL